jgi:hypothetical protein
MGSSTRIKMVRKLLYLHLDAIEVRTPLGAPFGNNSIRSAVATRAGLTNVFLGLP